jgi:hypothetical protein
MNIENSACAKKIPYNQKKSKKSYNPFLIESAVYLKLFNLNHEDIAHGYWANNWQIGFSRVLSLEIMG